jgi:hypothetical protein
VLGFAANQPIGLILVPYPLFSLASICFIVLSAYLVVLGIYSSALSVANDNVLCRAIRKSVEQQSDLLDKIGTAQMERQLQNRVLSLTRDLTDEMTEQTGVQSSLQNEQEIRDYVDMVIEEIKVTRRKNTGTT